MASQTAIKRAKKKVAAKKSPAKQTSRSYNAFKEFNGKAYTGMAIGRAHKWNYDKGVWRETKVTPERWELSYNVIKRRPPCSGSIWRASRHGLPLVYPCAPVCREIEC